MFLILLAVTLLLAAIVSWLVSRAFSRPIGSILDRIIADSISDAWRRHEVRHPGRRRVLGRANR